MSELHTEAPRATVSEGLAQGPYVAARAGVEPTTLWTKGDESTNEPPCPTRQELTTMTCLPKMPVILTLFLNLNGLDKLLFSMLFNPKHVPQ